MSDACLILVALLGKPAMCCHEFLHKAILSWYAVFLLDAPASGVEINQARISEPSHESYASLLMLNGNSTVENVSICLRRAAVRFLPHLIHFTNQQTCVRVLTHP